MLTKYDKISKERVLIHVVAEYILYMTQKSQGEWIFDLSKKTCVKWPLSKRQKIGFQDQISLNAGQKYCRMLCNTFDLHQATICHLDIFSGRFTQVLLAFKRTGIGTLIRTWDFSTARVIWGTFRIHTDNTLAIDMDCSAFGPGYVLWLFWTRLFTTI